MSVLHILDKKIWFPPVEDADEDGLLAAGGDLSIERLLLGYTKGIFPWYSGELPLWWSPDPRFVLFARKLHIPTSLRSALKKHRQGFTQNKAFAEVIHHCGSLPRAGQDGTWLNADMQQAYMRLHEAGYAHSFELWIDNKLAGGLYGIWLGKVFFGESQFTIFPNAGKIAFVYAVEYLQQQGIELIDCQVHTDHLERFGAEFISRIDFLDMLKLFL